MKSTFIKTVIALGASLAFASHADTPAIMKGFGDPTPCATDIRYGAENDPDVVKKGEATTVSVMFHGNRFVVAKELAKAFEETYPGQVVSYTAIPPMNTIKALSSNGEAAGMAGVFKPDVVMGSPTWASMPFGAFSGTQLLTSFGKYSDVRGIVLVARKDDNRVVGTDWKAIVKNEGLRLAIPGDQGRFHALVGTNEEAFGKEAFEALPKNPRIGFTDTRHHRSMPQRIKTGCEDVGLQFLQSRLFLEKTFPGAFKFVELPISERFQKPEESVVFTVKGSAHPVNGELFAKFMFSDKARAILAEYSLLPLP